MRFRLEVLVVWLAFLSLIGTVFFSIRAIGGMNDNVAFGDPTVSALLAVLCYVLTAVFFSFRFQSVSEPDDR